MATIFGRTNWRLKSRLLGEGTPEERRRKARLWKYFQTIDDCQIIDEWPAWVTTHMMAKHKKRTQRYQLFHFFTTNGVSPERASALIMHTDCRGGHCRSDGYTDKHKKHFQDMERALEEGKLGRKRQAFDMLSERKALTHHPEISSDRPPRPGRPYLTQPSSARRSWQGDWDRKWERTSDEITDLRDEVRQQWERRRAQNPEGAARWNRITREMLEGVVAQPRKRWRVYEGEREWEESE